uniref:calcium-binding protein n=1 Tax=Paraburkholderia heleia TaxID=634127 RepID=UPI002AB607E5
MATPMTTAQLEQARTMISSGDISGFYSYMASQGYNYAILAEGLVSGTSFSGAAAVNFLIASAAEQGVNFSSSQIPALEADMANQWVTALENVAGPTGTVDSDLDYQDTLAFHTQVFANFGLSPQTWTLYAPGQVLAPDYMQSLWQSMLGQLTNPAVGPAESEIQLTADMIEVASNTLNSQSSQIANSWLASNFANGGSDFATIFTAAASSFMAGLTKVGIIGTNLLSSLEELFQTALQTISPLELDLTGNGVQTVGQSAGVYFDYSGNGFAESTGWTAPKDGLLVLPGANGQVTQGSELFGNDTVLPNGTLASNGFQALAALDSNGDGVINASDPAYSQLRIWVGGNGQPGSGELLTLAQAGIQSLNLNYTTGDTTDANGNQIEEFGSYTLTNGTTLAMDDVWFSVNPANTVATGAPVNVSAAIAALPDLNGSGKVYSLQQAMARDGSGKLESLVQAFVADAGTMNLAQARSAAGAILLDWTGADQYLTTSRGQYVDGQQVYALEAFMGHGFIQSGGNAAAPGDPGPNAAAQLQQAYGMLLDWTTAELLAQTKFAPWLNEVSMTWNVSTNSLGVNVSQLVATLNGVYSSDPVNGAAWISEFGQSLDGMGGTGTEILSALQQQGSLFGTGFGLVLATMGYTAVAGSAGTPVINGVPNGNSALLGVSGETLIAGNGDDLLVARGGTETLDSGSGKDTFVFDRGSGQVLINDAYGVKTASPNQDVVQLGTGFTPAGTTVTRDLSNNLVLGFGGGDQITIEGYFNDGANNPSIRFADGTVWSYASVTSQLVFVDTSSGGHSLTGLTGVNNRIVGAANDTIQAGNLTDAITAGRNDTLDAGAGVDTFIYNTGDGAVTLNETKSKTAGTNQDVVQIGAGITAAATQITRDRAGDLILGFGNGDQITITGYFSNGANSPSIVFADGTAWSFTNVTNLLVYTDTSSGGHTLIGLTGVNNRIVGAANDTLQAGNLNDTLTAGRNDTLDAGA